jgi:hypothetical protein
MLSGTGTVTGGTVNLADGSVLTVSVYDADHGAINVVSVATSPAIINGSDNINLTNNGTLLEIPVEKGLILDENVILEGTRGERSKRRRSRACQWRTGYERRRHKGQPYYGWG